jgi:hypothetical protein
MDARGSPNLRPTQGPALHFHDGRDAPFRAATASALEMGACAPRGCNPKSERPGNRKVMMDFEPERASVAKRGSNGRLEEALAKVATSQADLVKSEASLVSNQASFLSNQAIFLSNQASFQANFMALTARTDEPFCSHRGRTRRDQGHSSPTRGDSPATRAILQKLPEAIRQRVGFEAR